MIEATPEMQAALDAFHDAKTRDEERVAYARMRALGFPPAYGEDAGATGWQPIETAPRGEDVLIVVDGEVSVGSMTNGLSGDDSWYWMTLEGAPMVDVPTHWMPLPCPPEVSEADRLKARVAELERDLEEGAAHEPEATLLERYRIVRASYGVELWEIDGDDSVLLTGHWPDNKIERWLQDREDADPDEQS